MTEIVQTEDHTNSHYILKGRVNVFYIISQYGNNARNITEFTGGAFKNR